MFKSILFVGALAFTGGAALQGAGETPRGFPIHDTATAPAATRPILEGYAKDFGFVPNTAAVMGESPALINAYAAAQKSLKEHASLSPLEVNIVQLAASVDNGCIYCTAAHSMVGEAMLQTPDEVLAAVRAGEPIADAKLQALRVFAARVAEERGAVSDAELEAFLAAGYTRAHALDVVACQAAKLMSNYTNRLASTPLDEPLKAFASSDAAEGRSGD